MPTAAAPPTVPRYVTRFINGLLRSPLHRLMSANTMLLGFVGRKSGKDYLVTVRYVDADGLITCYTDSGWWINLRGGAPVQMRIAGRQVRGTATAVNDPSIVAEHLSAFLHTTPGDSKYYGVQRGTDGLPDPAGVRAAAEYTAMIQITPQRSPAGGAAR